jgi:putative Mg2+ transporter-C (MgtC) family protein
MEPGSFLLSPDARDVALRLLTAAGIGMLMGLERLLRDKPVGMRTLGLVSFVAALVTLSLTHAAMVPGNPEALSRVFQGVVQGVLVGVGFLGSGVIVRDAVTVHNLTTAAEVWAAAGIGLASAVAPWGIVGLGAAIFLLLIVVFRVLEKRFHLKDH